MTAIVRKGLRWFHLTTRSYQLHATGFWAVEIEIRRKGRLRAFSGALHYPTEAEATAQAIALGRRIVAGHEPGCSVDSLY